MNRDPNNTEVEIYLRGDSELSTLYGNSKDQSAPEHINKAIEQLARKSLKESTGTTRNAGSWKWPLAMAASLVLAVLIVVIYRVDTNMQAGKQLAREDTKVRPIEPPVHVKPDSDIPQPVAKKKPAKAVSPETPADRVTKPPRENVAQQQQDDVPPKLQELLQQTRSGNTAMTRLLPDEVLKTWTRKQWREHVDKLEANHQEQLAEKYIKAYPRFFPGETLEQRNPTK